MDASSPMTALGIDQWSVDDRLNLIGEIWDSLSDEKLGEIPEWHREILDQRLAEADANPGAGRPWQEVMDDLFKRR